MKLCVPEGAHQDEFLRKLSLGGGLPEDCRMVLGRDGVNISSPVRKEMELVQLVGERIGLFSRTLGTTS